MGCRGSIPLRKNRLIQDESLMRIPSIGLAKVLYWGYTMYNTEQGDYT